MVAVQAGLIGPQADGSTPFQGPLDVARHEYWAALGQRSGIVSGLVASVVGGQMQLSFTAGGAMVRERDGSQVELDRAYSLYSPSTEVVQFGAASASNRNDAVVAAVVDVEDGAQGTGAIGVGGHLVVVPGVSGTTTVRTDAQIAAYLGRGGFHRLYDVPILSSATQINLAGATFTGHKINDWNAIVCSAASGWSLVAGKQRFMYIKPNFVHVELWFNRTGSTLTGGSDGNFGDNDLTTNFPAALRAVTDTVYGEFHVPGTTLGSCRVETAGNVTVTDTYPTATVVSGNVVRIRMSYAVI